MQLLYTIATRKVDFEPLRKAGASTNFYNLLRKLLHPDPTKRLGGDESDAASIKAHKFFEGLDWDAVQRLELTPIFKPAVKDARDTSNIDKSFLIERPVDSPTNKMLTFSQAEKVYFDQFTYNRDNEEFLFQDDAAQVTSPDSNKKESCFEGEVPESFRSPDKQEELAE